MPIYVKSIPSKQTSISLFNNLLTLFTLWLVDNYIVNYFVNSSFFRHLDLVNRIQV